MKPSRAVLITCLVAGCHRPQPVDHRAETPAPTASATAEPAPPAPLIDLLYRTKARVAVSSNVRNPKDYPEHLIDRRPDTAWNSKTGDLDARVLFRVPASARVRRILLTVGYDAQTAEGDLFTMNHRIKQVALTRDGGAVGTFDLDPEDRRPQAIELDEPGGTFELRATQTVPGSKLSWRELVISELSVLGTAPDDELLAPAMPQVTIGTLERQKSEGSPFEAVLRAAPFSSVADFCARHLAAEAKAIDRIKARDPDAFIWESTPYCTPVPGKVKVQRLASPFVSLDIVDLLEGADVSTRLLVKTDRGVYPTNIVFSHEHPGPGCGMSSGYVIDSATVEAPRAGAPILLLRATKREAYQMPGATNDFEAAGAFFIACTLDAGGAPACTEEIVASFDGDGSWTEKLREAPSLDPHPPRWDWQREASVDDEGHIRLSGCAGPKGAATTCTRRNADLLRRF